MILRYAPEAVLPAVHLNAVEAIMEASETTPRLRLNELMLSTAQVLHGCLTEVVAFGLDSGTRQILDADAGEYLDGMPEGDRVAYLYRLLRSLGLNREGAAGAHREGDRGLPQTRLDALAHASMEAKLVKLVKGSIVVGEEALPVDWDRALAARPGTYVWVLDAIDGSGPQDTVGFGYSANVILYVTQAGAPALPVMMVIVTSSSLMLGWIRPGTVGAAYLNVIDDSTGSPWIAEILQPLVDLEAIRDEERHDWVAIVAAQAKHRNAVRPLLTGDRWTVLTLGGAPAMPGLLIDKLAAVVIATPQSRHDAAPMLALAAGQGMNFVGIPTGEMYTDAEVRAFFLGIERPGVSYDPNPRYLAIPAMVIGRDPKIAIELANELREHWAELESEAKDAREGTGGARLSLAPLALDDDGDA